MPLVGLYPFIDTRQRDKNQYVFRRSRSGGYKPILGTLGQLQNLQISTAPSPSHVTARRYDDRARLRELQRAVQEAENEIDQLRRQYRDVKSAGAGEKTVVGETNVHYNGPVDSYNVCGGMRRTGIEEMDAGHVESFQRPTRHRTERAAGQAPCSVPRNRRPRVEFVDPYVARYGEEEDPECFRPDFFTSRPQGQFRPHRDGDLPSGHHGRPRRYRYHGDEEWPSIDVIGHMENTRRRLAENDRRRGQLLDELACRHRFDS